VQTWKYFCLLCEQNITELRVEGYGTRKLKSAVCPGCTRKAVDNRCDGMAEYCLPCENAGRAGVPATRYVPVKGKTVLMCESCWGGGNGPGVKPQEEQSQALPPAPKPMTFMVPPAKKKGRLESLADAAAGKDDGVPACRCGRKLHHRGRCAFNARVKSPAGPFPNLSKPDNKLLGDPFDGLLALLESRVEAYTKAIQSVKEVRELLRGEQ
jgi:hypothetical protein